MVIEIVAGSRGPDTAGSRVGGRWRPESGTSSSAKSGFTGHATSGPGWAAQRSICCRTFRTALPGVAGESDFQRIMASMAR